MGLAKTFLAIGIAIVLAVFVGYALWVILPPPDPNMNSDCYNMNKCYVLEQKECDPYFNETNPSYPLEKPRPVPQDGDCYARVQQNPEYKECNARQQKCEEDYLVSSGQYQHAKINFYLLLALGLAAIVVGIYIKKEGVGSGFIGGGILVILWVLPYTHIYWTNFNKYIKLFALGVVLAVLIYLGYKKFDLSKQNEEKRNKK